MHCSTDGKFRPASIFTQLHGLTLVARSYTLLCLHYALISTKAIRDGEETVVDQMTEMDVTHSRGGECSTNDFEVSNGTVLHWAAFYGKVEIVKKCLERGASKLTYL